MTIPTLHWGIPKPELDEPPNGPVQVTALADYLDANEHGTIAFVGQGTLAARPESSAMTPGKAGRRWLVQGDPDPNENGKEYLDIGVAWVALRGDVPDASVTNAKLVTDSVDGRVLAPNAVGAPELADASVDAAALQDGIINAIKIANSLKPSAGAANATEALRGIGAGAGQVVAGNDSRLTNTRTPSDNTVTGAKVHTSLKPSSGAADATETLRALGTTAGKAMPGNIASITVPGSLTTLAGDITSGGYLRSDFGVVVGDGFIITPGVDMILRPKSGGIVAVTDAPSVWNEIRALSFTPMSDSRLKKDVGPLTNALEGLRRLRGVRFAWKQNERPDIGLIAQEVQPVFPDLVSESSPEQESEPTLGLNYMGLIAVLVEAVKEIDRRLSALEKA